VSARVLGFISAGLAALALGSLVSMQTAAQGQAQPPQAGAAAPAAPAPTPWQPGQPLWSADRRGKSVPAPGGGVARSGCPEDIGPLFEQCAQERIKTFDPPRTEDGRPNFRGYWARSLQSMTLESRGPDMAEHRRSNGRRTHAIIDPPTGLFPYQPWAAKQREENFAKYVDPLAMLYPPGAHRFPYISSGGYRFLQPRGQDQIVFLMEEIHLTHVVPTDNRPHISPRIKLWEGDWVGRWEGNTLVIDITNTNGEQWYDQAGDFLSDAAHIVQRWTLIDPDVIHVQSTVEDPKVFTQPMKFSLAMVRLQWACPECKELFEEASFEGDRDLPTMFKSHTRYPGWNGLAAAKGR
jgi:hypothetical protein